jgi:hypothetical protein
MMAAWRRVRSLDASDRELAIEALRLIACVRVGLHVLPVSTVRGYLERRATANVRPVDRIAWAVKAIGRRLPGTTCLVEALVAHSMLQHHGHSATLRIGVRSGSRTPLDAHAWVECDGLVVVGDVDALTDYAVLA